MIIILCLTAALSLTFVLTLHRRLTSIFNHQSCAWGVRKRLPDRLAKPHEAPSETLATTTLSTIQDFMIWKRLYHQIQNIEENTEAVPDAWKQICRLLDQSSKTANTLPHHQNILSVDRFSREGFKNFIETFEKANITAWQQYTVRRRGGGSRELFVDREEAGEWLKQIAPIKLVDGAWLTRVYRATTPYRLMDVTRCAWQVCAEELGDGDLERNHVYLYDKLLKQAGCTLPPSHAKAFLDDGLRLNEPSKWRSAVAQLALGLFPDNLLPEILGFNLHFEMVSMETLMAAKELKEVGLDPYYFLLHISIDNSHSGHTAMAFEIVCRYMEIVRADEGQEAAHETWRRVQRGFLLSATSEVLSSATTDTIYHCPTDLASEFIEQQVATVFKAKSTAGFAIHCMSRCKIGPRTLGDWLSPESVGALRWQNEFLTALKTSTYWIQPGDSANSRFARELAWGGRMFGCFTRSESAVISRWIDGLSLCNTAVRPIPTVTSDVLRECSALEQIQPLADSDDLARWQAFGGTFDELAGLGIDHERIHPTTSSRVLPLWFAHTCLLQNFASVPSKTTNAVNCAMIRVLRAQAGLDIEGPWAAGTDEIYQPRSLSIIEFGFLLIKAWNLPHPTSLPHALQLWPCEFASRMLHLAMSPEKNKGLLTGMASAFAKLHAVMAMRQEFSCAQRQILRDIAAREETALRIIWKELKIDKEQYARCYCGYNIAQTEIVKCFG